MKLTLLVALLFLTLTSGKAQASPQITYSGKEVPLKKLFAVIKEQTGYVFFYRNEDIANVKPQTVSLNNVPLETALQRILKGQQLQFAIQGNTIAISKRKEMPETEMMEYAEPPDSIRGKVVNDKGEPQPGATILIKGTHRGVTANESGVFLLKNVPGNAVLVVSALGLKAKEVAAKPGTGLLVITLENSTEALGEVVVVGYGQVKKSDLTGAVASVPVGEIKKAAVTSLDQALQGRAAGVQVTQNSGAPGGATTIRIRGGNSIQGDNEPLYVIDGVPFKNGGSDRGSSFNVLSTLNPADIESMTILKDASSTAIYGSRGANGVVIINTKRGKAGRTIVTFDTYYGTQDVRRKYPVLNAREYAEFVNEANTNDGLQPVYTQQQIDSFGAGTDWQDQIFRTAPMATYQLLISGGDEKTQFALSAGYYTQKGVVVNSGFDRYSLRVNLDRKLNKRIKVGNSLTVNRTATNQSRTDGDLGGAGLVTMAALQFPPILKPRNADGSYLITDPALNFTADNPVALAKDSRNKNTAFRIF
ncbi:MAG TPA: SusC/RagA family TonB-linked outer membrane protein, partial [Chitinophaga sp.]|nr:SusC/RagA family TonB-linked outer membrane protein [Chitinophaga sp.]